MTVNNFCEIIKEESNVLVLKTAEEPHVLSTDQEIKKLEDKRRELRRKTGQRERKQKIQS